MKKTDEFLLTANKLAYNKIIKDKKHNAIKRSLRVGFYVIVWQLLIICMVNHSHAVLPKVMFSDMTDGPVSGWEQSTTKGAAISIWTRNVGSSRGTSYVTCGGVNLTSAGDYGEWGATTNPIVPLGMQRITFYLNSSMTTGGVFPNTTISVTTSEGTSATVPFHTRALGGNFIYYLDAGKADDTGNGLTAATAKKTTGWARGNLTAGDVCYLIGGTVYEEHDYEGGSGPDYGGLFTFGGGASPNHDIGTEGNSITVTAYPGDDVQMEATIESTGTVLKSCIHMYYAGSQLNYWTFSKFTMTASWAAISLGSSGYVTGGTNNIRIIGNDATTTLTAITQWGNIFIAYGNGLGANYIYYYGNYVHDQIADFRGQDNGRNGYQLYIGGYGALDHIYIGWNEFGWGSQGRGFQIYGHLVGDTLDNFYVHDNWFHDNKRQCVILGGGDGGSDYEFVKTCHFYNNIVSNPGVGWPTIVIGGVSWGRHGGDFFIYNNVFYRTGDAYPTMHMTGYIDSAKIINNIIYGYPSSFDYYTYYPDAAQLPALELRLTANNNLYFGAGPGAMPTWDSSTLDNNDPLFVVSPPVTYDDFALQTGPPASPAINAGSTDVASVVTNDFLHILWLGHTYEIGVYGVFDIAVPGGAAGFTNVLNGADFTVVTDGFGYIVIP